MNANAIVPEVLKVIPPELHQKFGVYAITINLTKDNKLIGYAHSDEVNACANTHKHRNEISKQLILLRHPDHREWKVYEYDNSCSRPRVGKLFLEDLTEEVLSSLIFDESVHGTNCPKTDWNNC
jgi:hypothetical protein